MVNDASRQLLDLRFASTAKGLRRRAVRIASRPGRRPVENGSGLFGKRIYGRRQRLKHDAPDVDLSRYDRLALGLVVHDKFALVRSRHFLLRPEHRLEGLLDSAVDCLQRHHAGLTDLGDEPASQPVLPLGRLDGVSGVEAGAGQEVERYADFR